MIVLLAASGSLTRSLQGNNTKNFFNDFIPIATLIVYCIGFGSPILIALLMKLFGTSSGFVPVICTYGYSYSIFLPVVIICAAPWEPLQWILLGYAIFSSTSLIAVNYYKIISTFGKAKKIGVIILVLIIQICIFLILKLYFFRKFTQEIHGNDEPINNRTNTTSTGNETSTNRY